MKIKMEFYDASENFEVNYTINATKIQSKYFVFCEIGNTESYLYEFMSKYELADLLETLESVDSKYELVEEFKPLNNVLNIRFVKNKVGFRNKAKKWMNLIWNSSKIDALRLFIKSEESGELKSHEIDKLVDKFCEEEDYNRMVAQYEMGWLDDEFRHFCGDKAEIYYTLYLE